MTRHCSSAPWSTRRLHRCHRGRHQRGNLGSALDRLADQRHPGPLAIAVGRRHRARPGPPGSAPASAVRPLLRTKRVLAPCRRRPTLAIGTGCDGRALVTPTLPRRRSDPAGPGHRRRTAGPLRRSHPWRRDRRARERGIFRHLPGTQGRRRTPVGSGAATSWMVSGQPNSRCPGAVDRLRSFNEAPAHRPRTGSGIGAGGHRPGQRLRRRLPWPVAARASGRPTGGRRGRPGASVAISRPARRVRWSCWSMAPVRSTSSAAVAPCCPSPTMAHVLQPAADALALAVRDGALGNCRSSVPTARRSWRPRWARP